MPKDAKEEAPTGTPKEVAQAERLAKNEENQKRQDAFGKKAEEFLQTHNE